LVQSRKCLECDEGEKLQLKLLRRFECHEGEDAMRRHWEVIWDKANKHSHFEAKPKSVMCLKGDRSLWFKQK